MTGRGRLRPVVPLLCSWDGRPFPVIGVWRPSSSYMISKSLWSPEPFRSSLLPSSFLLIAAWCLLLSSYLLSTNAATTGSTPFVSLSVPVPLTLHLCLSRLPMSFCAPAFLRACLSWTDSVCACSRACTRFVRDSTLDVIFSAKLLTPAVSSVSLQ